MYERTNVLPSGNSISIIQRVFSRGRAEGRCVAVRRRLTLQRGKCSQTHAADAEGKNTKIYEEKD